MSIKSFSITREQIEKRDYFPGEYRKPGIYFHGTSSINETQIETEGFKISNALDPWLFKSIEEIVHSISHSIMTRNGHRGYLVLDRKWQYAHTRGSYALKDIERNAGRTFFSDRPERVLRYASHDLVLGENFQEIPRFRKFAEFILDNLAELNIARRHGFKEARNKWFNNGFTPEHLLDEVESFNSVLAKEWLDRTSVLYSLYEQKHRQHFYGVIYVVDLKDEPSLEKTDEAFSGKNISSNRIVAKAVVPIISEEEASFFNF